jgi:toxin ParE1/3/4
LAEADLDEIWLHVAADSLSRADRLIARLQRTCRMLATNPSAGRRRKELGPGLRSFALLMYVVFYRQADHGIDVARILAGERDVPHVLDQ